MAIDSEFANDTALYVVAEKENLLILQQGRGNRFLRCFRSFDSLGQVQRILGRVFLSTTRSVNSRFYLGISR